MTGELSGQTAVVTGAAGGLGRAFTHALVRSGAHVIALDVDAVGLDALVRDTTEIRAKSVTPRIHDVTSAHEADALAQDLVDGGRTVEILINNAGTGGLAAPIHEIPVDYWNGLFDVHVNGMFHMTRTILPLMLTHRYGRIVNIASSAGKDGSPRAAAYSAAKAAIIAATKSVGRETATTGVLVNAVSPGVVSTPLNAKASDGYLDEMLSRVPMGRPAEPDEIAELVLFLSSPRVSFSTGAVFDASGGKCSC